MNQLLLEYYSDVDVISNFCHQHTEINNHRLLGLAQSHDKLMYQINTIKILSILIQIRIEYVKNHMSEIDYPQIH